jgi:hypothetical protein
MGGGLIWFVFFLPLSLVHCCCVALCFSGRHFFDTTVASLLFRFTTIFPPFFSSFFLVGCCRCGLKGDGGGELLSSFAYLTTIVGRKETMLPPRFCHPVRCESKRRLRVERFPASSLAVSAPIFRTDPCLSRAGRREMGCRCGWLIRLVAWWGVWCDISWIWDTHLHLLVA